MTDHLVTLAVSEQVYEYARRIADETSQPLERILQQRLEDLFRLPPLPPDEEAELAALRLLSDDTLWTIASEQMPSAHQEQRSVLLTLAKRGAITDQERLELDELLQRGDRLMVRKAEAAAILTERGHKLSPQDLGQRRLRPNEAF